MKLERLTDAGAWRGALWARRAVREARRQLRDRRLSEIAVAAPPGLPASADYGVHAVLRRLPSTCLERAVVLQRWRAAQGESRAIVIGVKRGDRDFLAHAWVEGESDPLAAAYEELMRVPALPGT